MNTSTLARLTLWSLSLAFLAGCSTTKKEAAAKPAPDAPVAETAAPAPAAPVAEAAPDAAKPAAKAAPSFNLFSRISWFITGLPASGAPGYDPATAPVVAPVLQDVIIRSTPPGATVSINGKEVGVTPLVATLDQAKSYDVSVLLAGYLMAQTTIRSEVHVASGPAGKSGMSGYAPAGLPHEVTLKLKPNQDPYKALTMAAVDLDNQLKKGKITPEQYKEKSAELARFYGPAK